MKKKIIGVCMTRVQDELNRVFLNDLREQTIQYGYSIVVFHSIFNFYDEANHDISDDNKDYEEVGAKRIFDMIPFEDLTALILVGGSIYDTTVVDNLIEHATYHKIPIIEIRGVDDRCISVYGDYKDNYRQLLQDIIVRYNLKNILYVGGLKGGDTDSNIRIEAFKEAYTNAGNTFSDSMVEYGEYWEGPTDEVINRRIIENGERPEAIFCANDTMAIEVIKQLKKINLRVPEDVLVTGFDGIESAMFHEPRISTCMEDNEDLARVVVGIIRDIEDKKPLEKLYTYSYKCTDCASSNREKIENPYEGISNVYAKFRTSETDEDSVNMWLDTVIASPNMENLVQSLSGIMTNGRALCVRQDSFVTAGDISAIDGSNISIDVTRLPEKMLLITRDMNGEYNQRLVSYKEIMTLLINHIPEDRIGLISIISTKRAIYGLALDTTDNITLDGVKANRYSRILNRALLVCSTGERQLQMARQISEAKYRDALTGLMNMDGLNKWYAESVANPSNRNKGMCVGVYSFMTYQEIADKCGPEVSEDLLHFIARSLTMANADASIARISVDCFAVLFLYPSQQNNSKIIDDAVSMFYNLLSVKRKTEKMSIIVDVSCGYTEANISEGVQLSHLISAAMSTLYKNRLNYQEKMPKQVDLTDERKIAEFKNMFMVLVNDNLFSYHFQPIVDVKSAKIVAYEALMRAPQHMKMSPLDILDAANVYRKLYDIERATFFNVFKCIADNKEVFEDRSVFINTIPGYFLNDYDVAELREIYGDCIEKAVVELTESETVTLEELANIKNMPGNDSILRVAVDDYGTGHSNIVNLMEYKPQVVKVDRYLITDIHKDTNKQMFFKSIVDFSTANNIKVLAEGVETLDELKTVIGFGADYIQGYYTAKPSPEFLLELPENIKDEIIDAVHVANER